MFVAEIGPYILYCFGILIVFHVILGSSFYCRHNAKKIYRTNKISLVLFLAVFWIFFA
jgi:hypothetical protein